MASLWRWLRRAIGKPSSDTERDDGGMQASARKYWAKKVADEGEHPPAKTPLSEADAAAKKSADQYWKREVAAEKTRRGTPEPPDRR